MMDLFNDKLVTGIDTKIKPHFDIEQEVLKFETIQTGLIEKHFEEIVCFKDDCVRKALIAMGWTPPKDKKHA